MRFRTVIAAVLVAILAFLDVLHHAAAIAAVVFGLLALVGLRQPRIGPWLYRTQWPPYQTDARRRRIAYVMCGGYASAVLCVGLGQLLFSTRQDALIRAPMIVLACAFGAGVVGLIAAVQFRQPRA